MAADITPVPTDALAPCPFCGGSPDLIDQQGIAWVTCAQCAADGPTADDGTLATERWNRRAQPAPAASPAPAYLPPLIAAQITHLRNTAYRDGKDGEPSGLLDRVQERLGAIILAELTKARQRHGIKEQ